MQGTYLMLLNDTAPDHITSRLNFNAWPLRVEVSNNCKSNKWNQNSYSLIHTSSFSAVEWGFDLSHSYTQHFNNCRENPFRVCYVLAYGQRETTDGNKIKFYCVVC